MQGDGDRQPRQRAGHGDVEEGAAVFSRRSHPDEGAEGPQRERDRDEVRERDVDAVATGRDVVAQLMHPQDRQQAQGIRQAHGELPGVL